MSIKAGVMVFFCAWCQSTLSAQQPNNDIVIYSIESQTDSLKLSDRAFHLTYRDGYDNQPKFSQDGKQIFFTRMLSSESAQQLQTDIFVYDFEKSYLRNVTSSPNDSEYSATPFDEQSITIIGVNTEGQQHLRKVDIASGQQTTISQQIEPVGYHAWLNDSLAAAFVLGEVMTLQFMRKQDPQPTEILAENIGRCLQSYAENHISFTVERDGIHEIYLLNNEKKITSTGIKLPKGTQDYVWWNEQQVLAGLDNELWLIGREEQQKIAGDKLGIKQITRLALAPDKRKLAIVYSR